MQIIKKITEKFHHFSVAHDEIRYFTILYILGAVVVSVFLNLFAFLVWIVVHYLMDLYKNIHEGYSTKFSVLKSIQDCKLDFMFFFIALGIDMILHYSAAAAAARGLQGAGRGMRFFGGIIKVLPRLAGGIKAAEGMSHIIVDILHHKSHKHKKHDRSEEVIKIGAWDYTCAVITFLSLSVAFYLLVSAGYSTAEIIHVIAQAMDPTHIQGLSLFAGDGH